ncbi:hypothetical protein NLU13_6251 [Sarocladium strictum]|uniref:Uncharacterized protein n=1 Tax=Sarocladium strictum TaxID=5046 RepID=A0AA39GG96_SARSR|nr:hypothetical protein NLU13_6251 [Sarocladium strictum]
MTSTSYYHRSTRVSDSTGPVDGHPSATGPTKPSRRDRDSKKQKSTPFDPDDLCRRLQIVLAEEKAYSERKRRSRANIDRTTIKPVSDDYTNRRGREVPLEIAANQATAARSAQVTAARKSVLPSSAAKRRSKDPMLDSSPLQWPEKDATDLYQHVPQVAATQFARTTSSEPTSDRSLVHKLSRKAMKFHMESPNALAGLKDSAAPDQQARTFHRVRSEREKTYSRNQFQHTAAILEASGDVDDRHNREAIYRHTFDTHFHTKHSLSAEGDENAHPRLSMSSTKGYQRGGARESTELPTVAYPVLTQDGAEHDEAAVRMEDHRVDWTQSDEKSSALLFPALRKSDSRWTLRGRLSFHRTSKSEKDLLTSEDRAPSPALRSPRSSFFARFKR